MVLFSSRQAFTSEERNALQYAEDNGVLVVAAAGNRGEGQSAWGQASKDFSNLVVVGSADGICRAEHSNFGRDLDILAPSQESGRMLEGTSLAAARVTGAIADIWSANPDLSGNQVQRILQSTATDLHTRGWDAQTGSGLLNVSEAVVAAKSTPGMGAIGRYSQSLQSIYPDELKVRAKPPRNPFSSTTHQPKRSDPLLGGSPKPKDPEAAINQDGLDLIKQFEGFEPKAYQDSGGVWTIGYGHTGTAEPGQSISKERATEFLKRDVREAENAVRRMVDVPLNSNQFSALTSLVYNIGSGNFSRSPVLKNLNAKNYKEAAAAFDVHNKGGGQVLKGLIRRRNAEQALFQTPDETSNQPNNSRRSAPLAPKSENKREEPKPGISAADKATQKLLETARQYIGVKEQAKNSGPEVEKFQKAVDGKAQGEPWCMSFTQFAIKSAESATKVDSKVFSSEHCLTVWNRSPKELRMSQPKPGSLVIWRHGNSSSGHVGIVEKSMQTVASPRLKEIPVVAKGSTAKAMEYIVANALWMGQAV
jgi:lysozyme